MAEARARQTEIAMESGRISTPVACGRTSPRMASDPTCSIPSSMACGRIPTLMALPRLVLCWFAVPRAPLSNSTH